MQQTRGQFGNIVEHEAVLPDHHRHHQAAHAEGVVGQEPGGVGGVEAGLQHRGDVDKVTQVQHEQPAVVGFVLIIPEKIGLNYTSLSFKQIL